MTTETKDPPPMNREDASNFLKRFEKLTDSLIRMTVDKLDQFSDFCKELENDMVFLSENPKTHEMRRTSNRWIRKSSEMREELAK